MSARLRLAGLVAALGSAAAMAQAPALRLEAQAERVARLHAQIGQNVLVERSRRGLADALATFERELGAARARAPGHEARDNFLLLALLWKDYRAWASKPPSPDHAARLAERVEELAWIAAKGARMMHGGDAAEPALAAASAASASQRLARLLMLRRWGLRPESSAGAIALASAELGHTLAKLRESRHATPAILTELQVAEGQLAFLLQAAREVQAGAASARPLEYLAKASDHLLESMERVARLYAQLSP
ncbi:MAG TPA: hypothetical protein VLC53_15335 [Myxococcota bacterium]|nr:hypothetical protein [Myxococcota bacterium]